MKTKKKQPEKRIFVIVPLYVKPDPRKDLLLKMSCGRLMAQVAHVVSKLKIRLGIGPDEETTTIILTVLNDRQLIEKLLGLAGANVHYEVFEDSNPKFYGTKRKIPTALATLLTKKKGKKFFWNLELWTCQVC
jgi:hypothetical protein